MVSVEVLTRIAFFQGLAARPLRHLAAAAAEVELGRGEYVAEQSDEAHALHILLAGSVQYLLRFEGIDELLVGTEKQPGALLGWSVFRPPYRHTASVRCEVPCRVLRVPREAFSEVFEAHPRVGFMLLKRVASALANRLEQARDVLTSTPAPQRRRST